MYANVIFNNDCILISFPSYSSKKSYFKSFYCEHGSRIREKVESFWAEGMRQGFWKYEHIEKHIMNSELKAASISKEENSEIIEFGNKIIKFINYLQGNINIPTNLFFCSKLTNERLNNFKYNDEFLQEFLCNVSRNNYAGFLDHQDEIENINKFDYSGKSNEIVYTDFQSGKNYIINAEKADVICELIKNGVLKGMINKQLCYF